MAGFRTACAAPVHQRDGPVYFAANGWWAECRCLHICKLVPFCLSLSFKDVGCLKRMFNAECLKWSVGPSRPAARPNVRALRKQRAPPMLCSRANGRSRAFTGGASHFISKPAACSTAFLRITHKETLSDCFQCSAGVSTLCCASA